MMLFAQGSNEKTFTKEEFTQLLKEALGKYPVEGKRILAIIPDTTRTLPMREIFALLLSDLLPRAQKLDCIIALGTHPPLSDTELKKHIGYTFAEAHARGITVFNHHFNNPQELFTVGVIPAPEVESITQGLLHTDIPVTVNKLILDYDELFIIGPVFPHEVVGFSGGYKYLFPGISGTEIIDQFHWLAALTTNPKIIGHKETPVRNILRRAAQFIPRPMVALSLVITGKEPCGIFLGDAESSWSQAADLSAEVNILWVDRPFRTVLSIAPEMYNELWVGGKCMYKLEPVVEDGGTIIIYAPHIQEISATHGKYLLEVGYHVRDFFLAQWEKYQHYPWGVLAHSTHVKGIGRYREGREYPRIRVVLATGISQEVCTRINLDYLDYRTIKREDLEGREGEGILVVPRAGEMLYRLKDGTVPDIDKL